MSDMFTRVRNLSAEEKAAIHLRANAGEALYLWELAVVLGYSYAVLLKWKRDGLPLVDRKLPKSEAWAWRKDFVFRPLTSRESLVNENHIPKVLRRVS